jgi:hypothetical protein
MLNTTAKTAAPAKGATAAPNVIRSFSGVTRQEREAAERLGAIYQELVGLKIHSLGKWAIPPPEVTPFAEYNREFERALIATYNFNLDRELRARGARPDTLTASVVQTIELQRRYRSDYYLIVPAIMQSAAVFAKKCLDAEIVALSQLLVGLTEQSSVAESLNVTAKDILAAARDALPQAMRKEEAVRAGRPDPPENVSQESGKGISYLSPTEVREILLQLARRKARYAGNHLIEVLLEHPEGMTILEEYAKSPEKGTVASTTRVREALGALNKFSESTIKGGTFLRYPFFVLGGVVELNLHEIPGFKEYAVEIAKILANDPRIEALGLGAIIVGCLSLALAGPAAPAIATVLLAGTDLALSGMLVFLEFMREREQDLGSRASAYRRQPIAAPSLFTSTALAAASAMVSALAFFGAAAQFRQVLNAPAKARATAPTTPAPVKPLLNERGLPTNRVGGASLEDARATTPGQTGVAKATANGTSEMVTPNVSSSTATTTEVKEASAKPAKRRIKFSVRDNLPEQKEVSPTNAKLGDKSSEPQLARATESDPKAASGKPKPSEQANSPKQRAVPPPPPQPQPLSTKQRVQGLGDWDTVGKLNIKRKIKTLKPDLKTFNTASPDPAYKKYESAVTQEYLEKYARQLSDKRLVRTYPGQTGRGTQSSGVTNQLKTQKMLLGEEGNLIRQPDAYMEVVPKSGGERHEAHFFEITLMNEFEAEIGFAGHKQKQISGTVWLAGKLPRTGFTQDTRLYYHIFCPEEPTQQTIDFLNHIMELEPRLEINWVVVTWQ